MFDSSVNFSVHFPYGKFQLEQVNPILVFFYHFFKLIVRVSLWVFYRRTTVVNRKGTKIQGPCILVSNHPSTLLDPLNVAIHVPRYIHFLANASLFKTRFTNWFFNTFFCIPIERYQDTGGKPLNNAASFARAIDFLSGGGILFIAPEGSSYVERRIRKLKTGAARIALSTEAEHDFKVGLQILPVGINYSDPTQFRSTVTTIFGQPIQVADFQKIWKDNPIQGVQKLTEHVRHCLAELTTDVTDKEEEIILEKVEEVSQMEEPLPPGKEFQRSQKILAKLKKWREGEPAQLNNLKALLKKVETYPNTIGKAMPLKLALTFPLFIYGMVIHFPPAFFTKKIADVLNDDLHWVPTYKYGFGVFIYPLTLGLEIWLLSKLPGRLPKWEFIVSIVPAGLLVDWWLMNWNALRAKRKVKNFAEQKQMRTEILEVLNL